jgi:bifunctional UDP-N-acetylglucosamine pyrophosphorylase/glucosamine-1-phosphate N-acetyltransferase
VKKTACVILAAGEGKRMKSAVPKVLHDLCGRPMLGWVVAAVERLRPEKIVVVAGRHAASIGEAVASQQVSVAVQKKPRGTADALSSARGLLGDFRGTVFVVNGDSPLVSPETARLFLRRHAAERNALSVLSFEASDPSQYGRIVRGAAGEVLAIVEDRDADAVRKEIREVNSGVYAIGPEALRLLDRIRVNRASGEYFLTDIVSAALRQGLKTAAYCMGKEEEFLGVNTARELHRASRLMQKRLIQEWMDRGVRFIDAGSAYIHAGVRIGSGTTIYPNVHIEGGTVIGKGATIFPNVRIVDSAIDAKAVILDSSVIEGSRIRVSASVGPFTHVRPGSDIGADARIGNFVELKKTVVGRGSKASHLSYLGDATIGASVNIGAGTITCNYDGRKKHATVIGSRVFVGSDTQLVAPVKVGRGAYIGAGSTITKDVPPGSLAVSRPEQKNIPGWARKRDRRGRKK